MFWGGGSHSGFRFPPRIAIKLIQIKIYIKEEEENQRWKDIIQTQQQNTESLLSMNNRNLPYDCINDTSKITQSIIHEHKYT